MLPSMDQVRHALRSTTAAPTIFTPLSLDGTAYCDGAFFANNPTAAAYYEAQRLYPGVPVELVLSIGSGCFFEVETETFEYGWDKVVNQLIESSTDTQRVHETLMNFLPPST